MKKIYLAFSIVCCLFYGKEAVAQHGEGHLSSAEQPTVTKSHHGKKSKKSDEKAVSDGNFVLGLNCDLFTGGASNPYKKAVDLFAIREVLFANDHVQFQFLSGIGYMSGGQKQWFASVFNTSPADVIKVPNTIGVKLDISFAGVVFNKPGYGLSVGPTAGFRVNFMPSVDMTAASTNEYSSVPLLLNPTLGIRANGYITKYLYLGLAWNSAFKASYSNELRDGTTTTPLNGNYISFSIAVRGLVEQTIYRPNLYSF